MYAYTADSPENAKANVMVYAGRMFGGDLKWTFNNAVDDASSDVNAALKAMLTGYTTQLVSVQGEGEINGGSGGGSSNACIKEYVEATKVNTDNAFTIAGSSTTNGGTQQYNGTSLASGLKMDSKGSIRFTTITDEAVLMVGVVSKSSGGSLKVNDTEAITAIGTTFVEKFFTLGNTGEYTITKGTNENYVYYVVVKENCQTATANHLENKKEIQLVSYYNVLGLPVTESTQGLIIVKTVYIDGTSSSGKVYKLNK
jgi:pectate lyase